MTTSPQDNDTRTLGRGYLRLVPPRSRSGDRGSAGPERPPAPGVDLSALLGEVHELRQAAWERAGIAVTISIDAGAPAIAGDPRLCLQAVLSLVRHAEEQVNRCPSPRIELRARAEGGQGVIELIDNGRGLSHDALVQISEAVSGSWSGDDDVCWLGLARYIAGAHNGCLAVESAEGSGSSYKLSMPAGSAAPSQRGEGTGAPLGRYRVLLVESDPAVRRMLARAIELMGNECIGAASFVSAAGALESGRFDVVLCDAHAISEERDLLDMLERQGPGVMARTVLLTTGPRGAHREGSPRGPRVVTKPFGVADLVAAIHSVVAER